VIIKQWIESSYMMGSRR